MSVIDKICEFISLNKAYTVATIITIGRELIIQLNVTYIPFKITY